MSTTLGEIPKQEDAYPAIDPDCTLPRVSNSQNSLSLFLVISGYQQLAEAASQSDEDLRTVYANALHDREELEKQDDLHCSSNPAYCTRD